MTENKKADKPFEADNVNEEMGADFAYDGPMVRNDREDVVAERDETESGGMTLGWVALVFAAVSWFIWPVLMGATATVLGFIAFRQGAKSLGGWSMGIGLSALALNLIIVPFYYALT